LIGVAARHQSHDDVVVERNGIRFQIAARRRSPARASTRRKATFTFVDPGVLSGTWTWTLGRRGLSFRSQRSRS
jgi:hypothetical protein